MWEAFRKKGNDEIFSGTEMSVRCYESHPVLKLGKGKLYGGSASYPVVKDADVYVSLQRGSTSGRISDPWDPQVVIEVQHAISDMHAPTNATRFKKMVTWVCNQLHEGKTVHVGCIGGHGRTGTVLSAIVAEMLEKKDAIQYVRKHYCKKVVESKEQVQFLMKHYGVSDATPTKGEERGGGSGNGRSLSPRTLFPAVSRPSKKVLPEGATSATKTFEPMKSARSLHKPRV